MSWMTNLVQTGRDMKKFLGLCLSLGPARQWVAGRELPGGHGLASPLSHGPCLRKVQNSGIGLEIGGHPPMFPMGMFAEFGPDRQRNEKVPGTPYEAAIASGKPGRPASLPICSLGKIASKTFSVFHRFQSNLVCPLSGRVDDRPPTLKKKSVASKWHLVI